MNIIQINVTRSDVSELFHFRLEVPDPIFVIVLSPIFLIFDIRGCLIFFSCHKKVLTAEICFLCKLIED